MSDTHFYEKIDAEMKTFPWNYPEQYMISEFLPSPGAGPTSFTG